MDARRRKASALWLRHSQSIGEPSAATEPRQGPLDDPALGQDEESLGLIGSLDDLDVHAGQGLLHRGLKLRPLVAAIGVELEEKREGTEQARGHQRSAVAILDVAGVHERVHQEALRIDQDMPLLALDLLAGVVARLVDRRPPFSALFTLWLSMIAAVGLASREAASRHFT